MMESIFYRLKTKVKGIAPSDLEHQGGFFFFFFSFKLSGYDTIKRLFESMVLGTKTEIQINGTK